MRALFDTHTWLWYLRGSKRLSATHRRIIEDETTELWLSPISIWEVHLLIEKGRMKVGEPPATWIRNALHALRVREAAITFAIARRSRSVGLQHDDPADRFIAATALEMKLTLLTEDERLVRCRELNCAGS